MAVGAEECPASPYLQNDTAASVAVKLASSINSTGGSVVTATPSGSAVNLLSNAAGAASNNFVLSVSVSDGMGVLYPYLAAYPSFQLDAENPTGGAAADSSYGTIYSYAIPQGGYAPNGRGPRDSGSPTSDCCSLG
jgi:phage tail sheath gpL-like